MHRAPSRWTNNAFTETQSIFLEETAANSQSVTVLNGCDASPVLPLKSMFIRVCLLRTCQYRVGCSIFEGLRQLTRSQALSPSVQQGEAPLKLRRPKALVVPSLSPFAVDNLSLIELLFKPYHR